MTATYQITVTKKPEYNPQATTGDAQARTELIVEWTNRPTELQIEQFERTYPVSVYYAFHFCEHLGKVHETV